MPHDNAKGIELLEITFLSRGWRYVVGRDDEGFVVTFDCYEGRGSTLHEAAWAAIRAAEEAMKVKAGETW